MISKVRPGADPVKLVAGYESYTLRILSESPGFYESGTADNFVSKLGDGVFLCSGPYKEILKTDQTKEQSWE